MSDIKIQGKTLREIADDYFADSDINQSEIELLKRGFIEGLEYLYPLYESKRDLVDLYKKFIKR